MTFVINHQEHNKIIDLLKIGEFNISPKSSSFREMQKYIRSIEDESKIMAELELHTSICFKIFDEINVDIMNNFVRKYIESEGRFLGRIAIIKHVACMAYDMVLLNRMEHVHDPLFNLLLQTINELSKEINFRTSPRSDCSN